MDLLTRSIEFKADWKGNSKMDYALRLIVILLAGMITASPQSLWAEELDFFSECNSEEKEITLIVPKEKQFKDKPWSVDSPSFDPNHCQQKSIAIIELLENFEKSGSDGEGVKYTGNPCKEKCVDSDTCLPAKILFTVGRDSGHEIELPSNSQTGENYYRYRYRNDWQSKNPTAYVKVTCSCCDCTSGD